MIIRGVCGLPFITIKMKKSFYAVAALLAGALIAPSCSDKSAIKLESNIDSISYAQGLLVGSQYKMLMESEKMKGNKDAFYEAFNQGFSEDSSQYLMTKEEAYNVIQEYNQRLKDEAKEKKENELKEQRAFNKMKSDKFIEEFKNGSGVIPMENGIYYRILKEGFGPKPTTKDTAVVHYEGKLIDGKVFDSSYKRGVPLKVTPKDAIKGLGLVMQEMPVGSSWEVVIPSELAYGEIGAQDVIPGNSALKFKVEMLNVIKPKR